MAHPEGRALGELAARRLAGVERVTIDPGLTQAELASVERGYGFTFADDHAAFLAAGLPSGQGWPDWRGGDPDELADRLRWPVDGVLFDVAHNGYWYASWGRRPSEVEDAVALADEWLAAVPRMVPVYGHRYLPAGRGTSGHPVLSMVQTDIITYGADLLDYVGHEFWGEPARPATATVEFWRDLVR